MSICKSYNLLLLIHLAFQEWLSCDLTNALTSKQPNTHTRKMIFLRKMFHNVNLLWDKSTTRQVFGLLNGDL